METPNWPAEDKTFYFELKKILMEGKRWSVDLELNGFRYDLFPQYEVKLTPDLSEFDNQIMIINGRIRDHRATLLADVDPDFEDKMEKERVEILINMENRKLACPEYSFAGTLKAHKQTMDGIRMTLAVGSDVIPCLNEKLSSIEYYKVQLIRLISNEKQ